MRVETQKVPVIIPTHIHQKEKAPGVAKRSVTIVWHASSFLSLQTFWKFAIVSPTKKKPIKKKKTKKSTKIVEHYSSEGSISSVSMESLTHHKTKN